MELEGKKINFLGDSITEGYGTSAPDKRYFELIAAQYGCTCRGYGVGGTRIARQHKPSEPKYDRDFCMRVSEMDKDADVIVVFGGTNDFGHGDAPIGSFSDCSPMTFYGALHTLFTSLIEKYPDAEIVVMTPLHRLEENNKRFDGAVLADFVNIITEVAAYYSIPVLDLFRTAKIQPAVKVLCEKYMPDGLHPNDSGHKIIADRLVGLLKSL